LQCIGISYQVIKKDATFTHIFCRQVLSVTCLKISIAPGYKPELVEQGWTPVWWGATLVWAATELQGRGSQPHTNMCY